MRKNPIKEIDNYHLEFLKELLELNFFKNTTNRAYRTFAIDQAKFIESIEKDPFVQEDSAAIIEHLKTDKEKLTLYPELVLTMTFIYAIATFEAYFTNITAEFFRASITNLNSTKKTLTYENILKAKSLRTLKEDIIKAELYEIGYLSFKEKLSFLENRFKIIFNHKMVSNSKTDSNKFNLEALSEIFSRRNIIMHHGGSVDEKYLKDNPKYKFRKGVILKIDVDYFSNAIHHLIDIGTILATSYIDKIKPKQTSN
ncbi:MAG: hypothetical protein IPK31_03640 [Chitinophagaceae bacterium]|nr:hypothetical protein [Chitinophagaceae bacterium]